MGLILVVVATFDERLNNAMSGWFPSLLSIHIKKFTKMTVFDGLEESAAPNQA
jgi:hypothetical protein